MRTSERLFPRPGMVDEVSLELARLIHLRVLIQDMLQGDDGLAQNTAHIHPALGTLTRMTFEEAVQSPLMVPVAFSVLKSALPTVHKDTYVPAQNTTVSMFTKFYDADARCAKMEFDGKAATQRTRRRAIRYHAAHLVLSDTGIFVPAEDKMNMLEQAIRLGTNPESPELTDADRVCFEADVERIGNRAIRAIEDKAVLLVDYPLPVFARAEAGLAAFVNRFRTDAASGNW
ncbi:hypothetical protein KC959_01450 [Candidatus Saccharibacteria bacterium]|nr:hypothetical protein [Candidatus Saccharibacteria bacterium]